MSMTTSGQFLSPARQAEIEPFETAPRPLVGYAKDYPDGLSTGMHAHPRAQLMYAVSGVMRIDTSDSSFIVPPSRALFLPADAMHSVRMDGPVAMRELFLREDAATRIAKRTAVIAVSPLLREVILAACAEPLQWDVDGRGHHLTELALDEIVRAASLPLGLPIPRDLRLRRIISVLRARPSDPRGLEELGAMAGASSRTLARLFRTETGLSFRQWRQQARMIEAMNALLTGSSPARSAAIAGYASLPAFGAAFHSLFGMTPRQARLASATTGTTANDSQAG